MSEGASQGRRPEQRIEWRDERSREEQLAHE
jgi:hypothetical protein